MRVAHTGKAGSLKLLIAAASGALLFFVLQIIAPLLPSVSVLHPSLAAPKGHPILALVFQIHAVLASPFMQPIYLAFFVVTTIVRRKQPNAWVTALCAGFGLPYVVFHFVGLI